MKKITNEIPFANISKDYYLFEGYHSQTLFVGEVTHKSEEFIDIRVESVLRGDHRKKYELIEMNRLGYIYTYWAIPVVYKGTNSSEYLEYML
jgi:hypothetical protein